MKDHSIVDLVAMSIKLDECRKTIKALYGPAFEGHVTAMAPMLSNLAALKDGNMIAGALEAVKKCADGRTVALILAVAVELSAREHAAAMQEGKS